MEDSYTIYIALCNATFEKASKDPAMSQITLSAILTLIRLAIVLLSKGARLVYSVVDLCDDGIINQSYEKPAWYAHIIRVITLLEDATSSLSNLEDNLTLPQNGK